MPNSFDTAKYLAMSPEEAEAYMAAAKGDDGQGDGGEATDENPAEQDADAQTEDQEAQAANGQGQGEEVAEQAQEQGRVKTVPHQALHESRQREREAQEKAAQLEARIAQMEAAQAQPQVAQAPAQPEPMASDLMFEDPAAINAHINQALESHPAIQELQQLRAEKVEREQMAQFVASVGDPNAADIVAQFDQAVPHLKAAGLPIAARYYMAEGVRSKSPEVQAEAAAKMQEAGRSMVVDQKAKELAGNKPSSQAPPNLAGIPPAAANGPTADMSRLSGKDMLNMPQAQLDAMRKGRQR